MKVRLIILKKNLPFFSANTLDLLLDKLFRQIFSNPENGLAYPIFRLVAYLVPMINVELAIINSQGKVLLTPRGASPDIPRKGWHLPGGIIRVGERLEDRIRKTAQSEVGLSLLEIRIVAYTEILVPRKISRRHFISFLAICGIDENISQSNENNGYEAAWFDSSEIPPDLIVNHERYREVLKQLCDSKGASLNSLMFIEQCKIFEKEFKNE